MSAKASRANTDYRPIIKALKQQLWRLESTSKDHIKAFPPNLADSMVCFSLNSGDPRALKNTIQDLRKSGFVWPWSPKNEIFNLTQEELPVMKAEIVIPTEEKAAEPLMTEVPKSVDQLFSDLKDSRTYAALAKEALLDAQKVLKEANAAATGSEEESDRAVEQMNLCKRAFDKAFDSGGL